jgi:hypothetical protein
MQDLRKTSALVAAPERYDKTIFKPSTPSTARKAHLGERFAKVTSDPRASGMQTESAFR